MNKKEPTGHFVPSSGFLNDGIKKWKPKEPSTNPRDAIYLHHVQKYDERPKEPIDDYVLSADGYCLNPKKLIEKFLDSLKHIKNYYKDHELFKLALIDEEIEKWKKELER